MANGVGVGRGRGSSGGYFWRAPLGTALPTDAKTALASAYKAVSLISADGVTDNSNEETLDVTDWAGNSVYSTVTSQSIVYDVTLIETTKASMECVHGASNVSGTDDSFSVERGNPAKTDRGEYVYVFEELLRDDLIKRQVIPRGKVTTIDGVSYAPGSEVGYPIHVTALYDETAGFAAKEYVEKVTANSGGGGDG